jgi:chemotaxis signal transduction protein
MRDDFIDAYPDAVQEFVNMLVQAGQFIAQEPEKAAAIAVEFLDPEKKLGLSVPILRNVLKEPRGIKTDDLFPVIEDLDRIQRYMAEEMGIGTLIDLEKFVDTRFAQVACDKMACVKRRSVFHDMSNVVSAIINRQVTEDTKRNGPDREGKYLLFALDNQEYGIGILSVKEIIGMMSIRAVPQTPPLFKGVINLRGKVIPVIDLRLKFALEEQAYNERTSIIVLEVRGKDRPMEVGIVVDSVCEVLNIKAADIDETPSFGSSMDTDFILAMAKMDGGVKTLLDANGLFSSTERQMIGQVD